MVTTARFRLEVLAILLIVACGVAGSRTWGDEAPHAGLSDYQVKAAYLYYFSTFVDWPAETFSRSGDPLIIGVLGEDPFGKVLDETIQGKTVNARRLIVKRFQTIKDARESQILFISSSEEEHLANIFKALEGSTVLTVGEAERFASRGGQIGFRMEDRKVRFDINVAAVGHARLKISAQLMKLGRIVEGSERQGG